MRFEQELIFRAECELPERRLDSEFDVRLCNGVVPDGSTKIVKFGFLHNSRSSSSSVSHKSIVANDW